MPEDPLTPQNVPTEPTASTPATTSPPVSALGATSTGMAPNIAAVLAVIFTFITGIIFLLIEKRNQYVRFWAMQATIFGLLCVGISILITVLASVFSGSLSILTLLLQIARLYNLAVLIVVIVMAYFAYSGKEWELPVIGKLARQQLLKFPPKL